MQERYWMFQRKGMFYVEDKLNGKQKSLKTRDAAAARRMFAGMNQRAEQPLMNLAMAKVYLSAKSDVNLGTSGAGLLRSIMPPVLTAHIVKPLRHRNLRYEGIQRFRKRLIRLAPHRRRIMKVSDQVKPDVFCT